MKKIDKKILVAGMGRTGTHLLQAISIKINISNKNVSHCHYFDLSLKNWADVIVSTKRYLKSLGHGYFSQHKNPDGSWRNKTIYEECEMAMKIYEDWEPYTQIILPLEEWFTNPKGYLKKVFDLFDLDDEEWIDRLSKELQGSVVGPKNPKHITKTSELKNYTNTLTELELSEIDRFFDDNPEINKADFIYLENYETDKE